MKNIIVKFITNTISNEELERLREWLREDENQKIFESYIKDYYDVHLLMARPSIDTAYKKVWTQINEHEKPVKKLAPYWFRYVAAASVVLMIALSYVVFHNKSEIVPTELRNSTIKVGTDKATLTLEDGSDIVLEKGNTYKSTNVNSNGEELIYSKKNTSTTTKREIAYNYLTVPRGGEFYVELSDGTKVWLNSESKLKYPVAFEKDELRQVELVYGEAFFDVSSSKNHNGSFFRVLNQIQEVEVLGTEFNITAYPENDEIITTLVEGKVSISNGLKNENLEPNQQSRLNIKTEEINIASVDVFDVISWKNGIFSFKEKPLEEIMDVLSRWYDVKVSYEKNELKQINYSGVFNRQQNIDEILLIFQDTKTLTFEIKNKIIIINE